MMTVKEIETGQRQIELVGDMPAQPRIELDIFRHHGIGKRAHIAEIRVEAHASAALDTEVMATSASCSSDIWLMSFCANCWADAGATRASKDAAADKTLIFFDNRFPTAR